MIIFIFNSDCATGTDGLLFTISREIMIILIIDGLVEDHYFPYSFANWTGPEVLICLARIKINFLLLFSH